MISNRALHVSNKVSVGTATLSEAAESDALLGHHVVLDTHQLVNGQLIQFARLGANDFALQFQDTSMSREVKQRSQ